MITRRGFMKSGVAATATITPAVSLTAKAADSAVGRGYPFEMIIFPDSQYYQYILDEQRLDLFGLQTRWVADNIKRENIVFLTHVGDIINNEAKRWPYAKSSMDVIHGLIPYSMTFGNHDSGSPNCFGSKRYKGQDWYLGASSDSKAHAQTFNGGGTKYLHVNLPWGFNDNHLNWAKGIIRKNPGLPTIITTHSFLKDNSSGRNGMGDRLWKVLVEPFEQVFMTVNGHDWVSRHELGVTSSGRKVIHIQSDWQQIINGGNALFQKVIFDPRKNQIRVKTYSPLLDMFHTDYTGEYAYSVTFDKGMPTVNHEIIAPVKIWSGKGGSGNWSDVANWNKSVPGNGDIIRFHDSNNTNLKNNLAPGTSFAGIIFAPGKYSDKYRLSGNAITLTGDIVNMGGYGKNPRSGPEFDLPIRLVGDRQINTGDWDMTFNGVISGKGSLTKTHGRDYFHGSFDGGCHIGDVYLTAVNSYTGKTQITGGALILENKSSHNLMPRSPAIKLFLNAVLKVRGLAESTFVLAQKQTLHGTGKLDGHLTAERITAIQPGLTSPGTLHLLGDLSMKRGSYLSIRIGGHTGSYDQLTVKGLLKLDEPYLSLSRRNNFVPKAGDAFIIIKNIGNAPVDGTLLSGKGIDLPKGTPLKEDALISRNFMGSGLAAKITYKGGDGNDIAIVV